MDYSNKTNEQLITLLHEERADHLDTIRQTLDYLEIEETEENVTQTRGRTKFFLFTILCLAVAYMAIDLSIDYQTVGYGLNPWIALPIAAWAFLAPVSLAITKIKRVSL